jgi:hypothetical protein
MFVTDSTDPARATTKFTGANDMTSIKWGLVFAAVLPAHWAFGAKLVNPDIGYLWRAELNGPTQKCNVPQQIKFVLADAIVNGQIQFEKTTYFPKGRLEDSRAMELSLIRFYNDKKPLVTLTAKADGTWNGTWTSSKKGCTGKVRVVPR